MRIKYDSSSNNDMELRERILSAWKCDLGGSQNPELPDGFSFAESDARITMTFKSEKGLGLGKDGLNMQHNGAAFEAWAVALYTHYFKEQGSILLSEGNCSLPSDFFGQRHYCRFLFRAMWFSRQYEWFQLSDGLQKAVNDFAEFFSQETFVNNWPSGEARDKRGQNKKEEELSESQVEGMFASDRQDSLWALLESKHIKEGSTPFFRQLPVGLFKGEKAEANSVFTGKASAIDLWTISGDRMVPIELKTKNRMVGAITELLFYSAYCLETFTNKAKSVKRSDGKAYRGYTLLRDAAPKLTGVTGVLLLDEESHHPLITDRVIEVLNQGARKANVPISYAKVIYKDKDLRDCT